MDMPPTTVQQYAYTAITAPKTIRLVHIHPGNESDPVHLSLVTTALNVVPDFESISYCWGIAPSERQVICNGASLTITNSLFTGLVHFRHADRPRIVWADAICINQADATEKSNQVLLMPDIYSQATRTLVWLGIADDPVYGTVSPSVLTSIRQAFQLLPEIGDPENAAELAAKVQALRRVSQELHEEGKPNILDFDWTPLAALIARPWFRRKWVVQEVTLARQVVLYAGGGVEVPWVELANLTFSMEGMAVESLVSANLEERDRESGVERRRVTLQEDTNDDYETLVEARNSLSVLTPITVPLHCINAILMVQIFRHSGTLLDGVVNTTHFHCTDPRDHVYSLLSLGAVGPTVLPDYTASVGDVYKQFSIAMLVNGQSLKLLSLGPDKSLSTIFASERLEGLPSWVPDLRHTRADIMASYTVRPQAFFAGGRAKPIISVSSNQQVLSCQGRVIDTVKTFSTSLIELMLADIPEMRFWKDTVVDPLPERRSKRLVRWLEDCYHVAFGHGRSDKTAAVPSAEQMTAFSRTMVCGLDTMRNRLPPELIAAFPQYVEWATNRATERHDKNEKQSATMLHYSATIDESISALSATLKFCITESDRFGQIPLASQSGDCICVLTGGEVPFVIRPTGCGTYVLIGECYIDGIMDGEIFEAINATAELLETIHLE